MVGCIALCDWLTRMRLARPLIGAFVFLALIASVTTLFATGTMSGFYAVDAFGVLFLLVCLAALMPVPRPAYAYGPNVIYQDEIIRPPPEKPMQPAPPAPAAPAAPAAPVVQTG